MVRLRQDPDPQPNGELPPELGVCYVEDWEDPAPPPDYVGSSPEELATWRMLTARNRWRDARRAWCEANGVDVRTLPGGRPRWRSRGGDVGGAAARVGGSA